MFTSGPSLTAKAQGFLNAVAVVLTVTVISSLVDQLIPLFPIEAGIAQWRFEHVGIFLGNVPILMIELGLMVVVAMLAGSRTVIRIVSVIALLVGILMLPMLFTFLLDFVEVRRVVQVPNRQRFDLAAMKTGLFGGLFALPMIWMGWRGWVASAFEASGPRAKGDGLVVGQ